MTSVDTLSTLLFDAFCSDKNTQVNTFNKIVCLIEKVHLDDLDLYVVTFVVCSN